MIATEKCPVGSCSAGAAAAAVAAAGAAAEWTLCLSASRQTYWKQEAALYVTPGAEAAAHSDM